MRDAALDAQSLRCGRSPLLAAAQPLLLTPRRSQLTGYTPAETIGRNCRFLQGVATERNKVTAIRDALREERACSVVLANYTKSGRLFYNLFYLAPVHDSKGGNAIFYVGCQTEISAQLAAELDAAQEDGVPGDEAHARLTSAAPAIAAQAAALTTLLLKHVGSGHLLADAIGAAAAATDAAAAAGAPALPPAPGGVPAPASASPRHPNTAESVPSALLRSLVRIQQSFCLSDPAQLDAPIVHASQAFLDMCGYPAEEVVGRNCRFLQGADTDREAVARLRAGIVSGTPTTELLLNYRKDGTPFWNSVHVAPVRDASGAVVLLVGVQLDCTLREEGAGLAACSPSLAPGAKAGIPADVAQLGAVGAVRVAVRALRSSGLKRHSFEEPSTEVAPTES